jgi:hypothetical protein
MPDQPEANNSQSSGQAEDLSYILEENRQLHANDRHLEVEIMSNDSGTSKDGNNHVYLSKRARIIIVAVAALVVVAMTVLMVRVLPVGIGQNNELLNPGVAEGVVVESDSSHITIKSSDGELVAITTTPKTGPRIPIHPVGEQAKIPYLVSQSGKLLYDGPTPETE